MRTAPPFPKLEPPALVPLSDTLVAPALLDREKGRAAIEAAVRDGFLRPFDIGRATIEDPLALWVPFWRMAVSIDGFHLTVPSGGARRKDAFVMICARSAFPYEPKLPSIFGQLGAAKPIEVGPEELTSPSEIALLDNGAVILDADVDRAHAESRAMGLLLHAVSPTHAIYSTYEPKVISGSFCLYPLYFARYTYEGEARRHPGESMFVAVSGRTGQVVAAKHPSVARSVAAKIRRFLSFDRRL
jgi:hypothetical protein